MFEDGFRDGNPRKDNFNVLVVSPTPTHPTDQGNRKRIRQVCEEIQKRGGRIHFVYFPREWGGKIDLDAYTSMKEAWDFFYVVAPSFPPPYRTDNSHWHIDDWWDGAIGTFIGWLNGNISFDIAIVNYAFLSQALNCVPKKTLKILDTHDRLSDRKAILVENNLEPEFFYTSVEEERIALERADLILAIKDEEREFFHTITNKPVMTLGHLEEPNFVKRHVTADRALRLGFLGSDNPINRENLNRFLKIALPIFDAAEVDIEVVVAGSISRFFETGPKVRVIGRVGELREFYEEVDVCINPFEFSTGLKIKVVEGLSYGVPVVGTLNAFEGIATDLHYHRFETGVEVARFCIELARDQSQLNTMARECKNVFLSMRRQVSMAMDKIVALARQRTLLVPTADFFYEETAEQRRVASMIRMIADTTCCVMLYPYPADQQIQKAIRDWQWGIPLLFPQPAHGKQDGMTPVTEFHKILEAAEQHNAGALALLAPEYMAAAGPDRLTILDLAGSTSAARVRSLPKNIGKRMVITTDTMMVQAAAARKSDTSVLYIPGVSHQCAKPDDKLFNHVWILCQSENPVEMTLMARLALLLAGSWRTRHEIQIHVVSSGLVPEVPGFSTMKTYSLENLTLQNLPSPQLVVDFACNNPQFFTLRREALLSYTPLVRYSSAESSPMPPGFGEAYLTATSPTALLKTCHAIRMSSRLRRSIMRRTMDIVRRWYHPMSLEPLREILLDHILEQQASTWERLGLLKPVLASTAIVATALNFDEAFYLAVNSDVNAAVKSGLFANGFQHFDLHGRAENRQFRLRGE